MKPASPSEKIQQPREYVAKEDAVRAPRLESGNRGRGVHDVGRCPLCLDGVPSSHELISFTEYPTGQHELLAAWIGAHHGPFDPAQPLHRECLERCERELQGAQLHREQGRLFYIDLSLGRTPILPTPIRIGADLRFTGRGITIAFIDSGFYPHADLLEPENRILAMYDAVRDREVRDIGRLLSLDPPTQAWHGTMAAATAAGSGYASGGEYRGIASEVRLVLVRVMTPRFRIRTPQVVRALQWIRENHERLYIRVVNMSLGVDETAVSLDHPVVALVEELSARGVVMVAASGNNPANAIKPPGASPSAITVGGYNDYNSTEWMRREVWHSSHGNTLAGGTKPELLAPSIWVAAPVLPRTVVKQEADALFALAGASDEELMELVDELASHTKISERLHTARTPLHARSIVLARIAEEKLITSEYKHVDGTSFAAPIVASVVAQMLEARPDLTPAQVKEILCATADLLPGVAPEVQGHGVVNPARALEATLLLPGAPGLEPRMRTSSN